MNTFRNLQNRLGRTALTIAGIAIGILALTVVGALTERLQTIVSRAERMSNGVILAFAPHGETYVEMTTALHEAIAQIRDDPRVQSVYPMLLLPFRLELGRESRFGPAEVMVSFPNGARSEITQSLHIMSGRMLRDNDHRVVFIGSSVAQESHVGVGSIISLYGNSYTVVGVGEMGFTIFDSVLLVPYDDAHALLGQIISPTSNDQPEHPVSAFYVSTFDRGTAIALAHKISILTDFDARDPALLSSDLTSTMQMFTSIVFGGAAIALLIASFSIVNTMTISVTERLREIGIRKAIGASDQGIMREFLIEAAVIGTLGGLLGIAGGGAITFVLDLRSIQDGSLALFELTPRLAIGALVFSVIISILAGFIPALRAAKLDPIEALRKGV